MEEKSKKESFQSSPHIKEVFDFLPFGICILNQSGIITDANKTFLKVSEYQANEVLGRPFSMFFLNPKEIEKILHQIVETKSFLFRELILISKNKKEILTRTFFSLKSNTEGKVEGYIVGVEDITQLKELVGRLEEEIERKTLALEQKIKELEEAKEKEVILRIRERAKSRDIEVKVEELEKVKSALMNILEDIEEERKKTEEEKNKTLAIITNLNDGILMFDKEGKISLVNPQIEKFFQIKSEELIGKTISDLAQISQFKPIVELVGDELKQIFREEVEIREDLILEITTIPMMKIGEKIGTLMILHDITREKAIERMKSEFVSISAHQLRTPLSAIKWTLRMFLDGDLGELTKEQREYLEKTYQSNERMIRLVNDLLNVARIEEGRYIYKLVLADLIPICQSLIDLYKDEIEKNNLTLEFKTQDNLPKVKVDVEKISLAIQNLLENAIRYNLPGGQIEIELKKREKTIEFSIRDTGIGIPKDQQNRVFTKFFRAPNATKVDTEGSGLGLFITKNIIEAHGGKIWFESEEGKGTCFYFTLPAES